MKNYDVIYAENPSGLVAAVNEKVEAGWHPVGGVLWLRNNDKSIMFMQAIYKMPLRMVNAHEDDIKKLEDNPSQFSKGALVLFGIACGVLFTWVFYTFIK